MFTASETKCCTLACGIILLIMSCMHELLVWWNSRVKMYLKMAYTMCHLFNYTVSWYSVSSSPHLEGSEELIIAVAGFCLALI